MPEFWFLFSVHFFSYNYQLINPAHRLSDHGDTILAGCLFFHTASYSLTNPYMFRYVSQPAGWRTFVEGGNSKKYPASPAEVILLEVFLALFSAKPGSPASHIEANFVRLRLPRIGSILGQVIKAAESKSRSYLGLLDELLESVSC
jgi:hypothetical protein